MNLSLHHIPKVLLDCTSYLSTSNSPSCSRNPTERIWDFCHPVLSCWKQLFEDEYTVVIQGSAWLATKLGLPEVFKQCSVKQSVPKKVVPTPLHHQEPEFKF